MWVRQIMMGLIGLSSGGLIAGGLYGFIVELGVISDFADRTHTANQIRIYEGALALGGGLGNFLNIYRITIPLGTWALAVYGVFAGIFVGCWAMCLAEVLNVFPIFMRRTKLTSGISYMILGIALGKGIGSLIYFLSGW